MLKMSLSILLLGLSITAFSGEKSQERTDSETPALSIRTELKDEKCIQDFTIINQTGKSVCNIYVSPSYSDTWGNDALQDSVLQNGQSALIKMNSYGSHCDFDLKVVACDGAILEKRYDLCVLRSVTVQ